MLGGRPAGRVVGLVEGGSRSGRVDRNGRQTYEAVQLVEHGDAVDVGTRFHGDAAVESVGFGVRDRDCTSTFCRVRVFSGSCWIRGVLLTRS